jgi:hypothetical protein
MEVLDIFASFSHPVKYSVKESEYDRRNSLSGIGKDSITLLI